LQTVPFSRFLALVRATCTSAAGFIFEDELLKADPVRVSDGADQVLARIRKPFEQVIGTLETTQFIEKRSGRVRLSTHRSDIRYDRSKLLEHPVDAACRIARSLPKSESFMKKDRLAG
jgi:hypothetical protein